MEQNTKCTIKDILCALKDAYLRGGEQDFWDDSGWHVYLSGAGDLLLETACITAPPAFNEETDEEILPEFAVKNGMDGSILPEIFQDVVCSAMEQKRDASNEELLEALNYYLERDTFLVF